MLGGPSIPSSLPMPRHAWIDASAGVAGDMLLGALVDLGADLSAIADAVDAVLPNTVRLVVGEVVRAEQRACKVDIEVVGDDHPRRTWDDIRSLIESAELPTPVRTNALASFARLAEAESRVHGIPSEDVHFHEVGAWDSIADVVGVCAALHLLDVRSVSASPIALGSGRTGTAHGDLPVPVPAVLELSSGWEVFAGGTGELATPTGVALIRALTDTCETLPRLRVEAVGVGAGTKDFADRANVVRVVLGTLVEGTERPRDERLHVLECNVDDLDPRVWPDVLARLLEAGAADAWLTPILMKKGRPAHTLSVLCQPADRTLLQDLVMTLTTTFGVREHVVERTALRREWRPVSVAGHSVRIKVSLDDEGRVRHATPELDDAAAVAERSGLALRQVLDEAGASARAAGLTPGALLPPQADRSDPHGPA